MAMIPAQFIWFYSCPLKEFLYCTFPATPGPNTVEAQKLEHANIFMLDVHLSRYWGKGLGFQVVALL